MWPLYPLEANSRGRHIFFFPMLLHKKAKEWLGVASIKINGWSADISISYWCATMLGSNTPNLKVMGH
jgi:hypothetical protein